MMGLFGKKKETKEAGCRCGESRSADTLASAEAAEKDGGSVKVLGSGCAKCNELEAAVRSALEELGMGTEIEHVTDFSQIAAYGVMTTPALVVDGRVVSYGKVLKKDQAVELLRKVRG